MTAIVLPTSPLPQSANPMPLDYGGWQEPVNGGVTTRLDRLGSRFAIDFTIPRLRPEPNGRTWAAALVAGIGNDVIMPVPQVGLAIGAPGAPVVDGAGQAGTTLALRGLTPGYVIRQGQFLNLRDGTHDTWMLYQAQLQDWTVGTDGKVSLTVWPFRMPGLPDGAAAQFTPVIQGKLSGNEKGWTIERAGVRGLQFTVTERR